MSTMNKLANNKMKSYASSVNYEVNFRKMNSLKKRERIPRNVAMSTKTKDFIQKICYRKTASIDMTQYGFINDSKINPVNLMMKPLRAQLEKICGNPSGDAPVRKKTTVKKKVKVTNSRQHSSLPRSSRKTGNSSALKSPRTPKTVVSSAGTRSPRTRDGKVKIEADSISKTRKKKVTLVLPVAKGKKKLQGAI